MNGNRKSDKSIVPKKRANKFAGAPVKAESVERRDLAKENSVQQNRSRTQSRAQLQIALDRIRQKAAEDKEMQFTAGSRRQLCNLPAARTLSVSHRHMTVRFTSLWHHVYDVVRLRVAYYLLKRKASAGVDGVTWSEYGEALERIQTHPASEIGELLPDRWQPPDRSPD